ncbi:MAG TPA: hydantoinase/oxoprolinase family protein [Pyrinomonadaceae bacterium]|nr:hydantoinase/oxoprolinase family protein [Pyrinomonadaceae bacterium]
MPEHRTKSRSRKVRVGVDTGGTFTDFVFESNRQQILKVRSTPEDPSLAIKHGLKQVSSITGLPASLLEVVHGTTVGTNALLERRGARTALVTTKGFEDVLAIGRQARAELYNLDAVKPPPLVPDELRFGISERVAANGEILEPLKQKQLRALVARLKEAKIESVAICFLFSFLKPEHEQQVAAALGRLGIPLSVSHRILPEYREFERTSTVTINAYLQPLMGRYLTRLASDTSQLRVMQSSGGGISASAAADEPVRTILSGPAGGVVGALQTARAAGFEKIITFDMGGTSTDVALSEVDGVRLTTEASVAGMPIAIPMLDIHTVGAGGGSIARVDEGGSLRVGPESAGADPGPACYGYSLLPTVTDAHVVLGHFGGSGLLGGEFKLDEQRSLKAFTKLAIQMSAHAKRKITEIEAAQGVVTIANTNMERALRKISVERGHDTREFTLFPFGGAGGLHAVDLARALRIPKVIMPQAGGALSAAGLLAADVIKDQSRTVMLPCLPKLKKILAPAFDEMERSGTRALNTEGFGANRQRHERYLAMRYVGQSFEIEVRETKGNIVESFHRAHRERYGYAQETSVVEVVSARVRSIGLVNKTQRARAKIRKKITAKPSRTFEAYIDGKRTRVAVYSRDALGPGAELRSPCIVTEYSSTTLIPNNVHAEVDGFGNLILTI